jgi:hypothetical protein
VPDGVAERQAVVSQRVQVLPGETPGSPVARLPAAGEIPLVEAEQQSPCFEGRATGQSVT